MTELTRIWLFIQCNDYQELENFLCKGLDSKYFRLCCNYSTLPKGAIHKQMRYNDTQTNMSGCVPIKLFTKTVSSQI